MSEKTLEANPLTYDKGRTLHENDNNCTHDTIEIKPELVTNHLESKIFYEANDNEKEVAFKTDSPKFKHKNYSLIHPRVKTPLVDYSDEDPYEVLQRSSPSIVNERVSISNFKRRRPKGNATKSMYVVGDSMVGFRDGVPGAFSPVKQITRAKRRDVKSAPVLPEMTFEPERPPRKTRTKINTNQQARIYDRVYEEEGDEEMRKSSGSSNGSSDNDHFHQVMISTGNDVAETGVRIFDPSSNLPRRPSSTVVLPMSLSDDLSESGESWGSDFEQSIREDAEDEVTEEDVYEILGKPNEGVGAIDAGIYERIENLGITPRVEEEIPPLPPRHSHIFQDLHDPEKETYVEVNMEDELMFPAFLPSLDENADEVQLKRYQIIKCIVENEKLYMKSLNKLIKEYEEPLIKRNIIPPDRIKVIFKHVHEIIQCHQLFHMALGDRTREWVTNDVIGDVIYASFSKSIVLKAYSSFVHNFSNAMDSIKETCKLVPAFLIFLKKKAGISSYYHVLKNSAKNHLNRNNTKQSLYDLMRQPLERIPMLVTLTQELAKLTPLLHRDHFPLQMALTHLECLSDILSEKKRDSMFKHKVRQLDNYCIGLEKPLASKSRYYVRHDDMLLCIVEEGKILKTKLRRLFILNDLLICTGVLTKPKRLKALTSKKFKVKWCVPINDVQILDVGSGISFETEKKTLLTTKYSHLSSPRPGGGDSPKVLEDLQHDIEVIGEIVGKVSSLRRKYRFVDIKKVNTWYNDVKAFYEREHELVNMNWIEISIPSKNPQYKNIRYLFNVHSAEKRMEWLAEFDNAKLRLTHNNNPGWYLQEDNTYDGEAAVLRRTLPLIANMLPLFVIENKHKVECSLEVSMTSSLKPILWLFSGSDHVGMITLMEMNMSSVPHVVESFVACESRICCAERVPEEGCHSTAPYISNVSVWIGTMSGRILLFNPNEEQRYPYQSTSLNDAVVSIEYSRNRVFAGLANGTVACFRRKVDGQWDLRNPTVVCLQDSSDSVLSITEVALGSIWCSCGPNVYIMNAITLAIEKKLTLEQGDDDKSSIKHLVAYGLGVWVSTWRSSKLQLYHTETLDQLQVINVSTAVARMKNDIDMNIERISPEKLYITTLMARSGLLWVGTDQGLVITYPLPKLGGIPKVNGSPCISFHGHEGPVRHLYAFKVHKNVTQRNTGNEKPESKSFFYLDAFNEDFGQSVECLDTIGVDPSPPTPQYFEVEPDDMKAEKQKLFQMKGDESICPVDIADDEMEKEPGDEESNQQEIEDDPESQNDEPDYAEYDDNSPDSPEEGCTDSGVVIDIENEGRSADPEIKFNKENEKEGHFNENGKAEGDLEGLSAENNTNINKNTEGLKLPTDNPEENKEVENQTADIEKRDDLEANSSTLTEPESLDLQNIKSSTPNRESSQVIPMNRSESHQSKSYMDLTPGENSLLYRSVSGYELAVTNTDENSSEGVAESNQELMNSTVSSTDHQRTWDVICDHYKTMALPNSPAISFNEERKDTPSSQRSSPKSFDQRNYMPLLPDEREKSFTSSLSSGIGIKAYDKEMSFSSTYTRKNDAYGNYTSLTPHSKREADVRRETLLKPWYVVSIGVGHVDYRRPNKRGSKTAEFFRALSSGGPLSNQSNESMLLAWKLC